MIKFLKILAKKFDLNQHEYMTNELLSGVEKNIELQAAGLLALAREELAFSEARGEIAQKNLIERLRACLNSTLEIQIADIGWHQLRILQVNSDHLVAIKTSRIFLIKFNSLVTVKGLNTSTRTANKIEASWKVNSTLRQWMVEQAIVSTFLPSAITFNGKICRIYQDHFDLITDDGVVTITTAALILVVKTHA